MRPSWESAHRPRDRQCSFSSGTINRSETTSQEGRKWEANRENEAPLIPPCSVLLKSLEVSRACGRREEEDPRQEEGAAGASVTCLQGCREAALCPPSLPPHLMSNPPRDSGVPEHHPTPAVHTGPVCGQPSQPRRPQPTGIRGGLCRAGERAAAVEAPRAGSSGLPSRE